MAKIATFYDHIRDMSRQESISFMDALQVAKDMGVEALEVSANNLLGREDEVGQELAMMDLEISSIPAYFDFGRDDDVVRQATPVLEAASYLGAPRILVIPGFWGEEDSPEARETQTQAMIQGINRLEDLAEGYGVSLVMEDYDSSLAPFSNTAGVRRFLDECRGLDCTFDSGNFIVAGEAWETAYEALKDKIAQVHLKDRAFQPLREEEKAKALGGKELYPAPTGGGDLHLEKLVAWLRRDGFDGIYTIEHYGAASAMEYLSRSTDWLREQLA